jgi:glycosyltransferase involved in cell wall biosynthesis
MKKKLKFTIITSCYRGALHLPRLYENLAAHHASGAEFEWILVDDFSNDNGQTVQAIEKIVETAPFPAKAIFLEKNYYAARSVREAAKVASGEYVIILDQDDFLSAQAFAVFSGLLDKYAGIENFAGVCGRCTDLDGELIGTPFKWKERLSNELEVRHIYKIRGELYQCTRKELVEQYCCDMKPGYTNGYVWARIARRHQYVYTSEVVRIYNTANPDSHSNSKLIKHVENVFEFYSYYIKSNVDYLRKDLRSYLILLLHCLRYAQHSRIEQQAFTRDMPADMKLLATLLYPAGAYLAKRDLRKGRIVYAGNEVGC